MRIPENQIESILERADIVDFVSRHVKLRQRGQNFTGNCPFHQEKTPSFTVSQKKQIYYCFGCHKGGNVFIFMMEILRLPYIEAVETVAKEIGFEIKYEKGLEDGQKSELDIFYEICQEVANFYSNSLHNTPDALKAREYFASRNVSQTAQRSFNLGFSIRGKGGVLDFLETRKIEVSKAIELGIVGRNDSGTLYDRFGGRLIFPLFSTQGKVIGFAGRLLEKNDNAGKYINSIESKLYHKGNELYGLWVSKDEIRKTGSAVVVEGYLDLISLYQAGVKNVVAVSGTALTEKQISLLSRYTKEVSLFFDSDSAGVNASMRSIELLLKQNMNVTIGSLPLGEDPDSFVVKNGKNAFMAEVLQAKNFLEYQASIFKQKGLFDDPSTAAIAIRDLISPLTFLKDELKQNFHIQKISREFNLPENLLFKELRDAVALLNNNSRRDINRTEIRADEKKEEKPATKINSTPKISKAMISNEIELLKLAFNENSDILKFIMYFVKPDEFGDENHALIFEAICDVIANDEIPTSNKIVLRFKDNPISGYLSSLVLEEHTVGEKIEGFLPTKDLNIHIKSAIDIVKRFKLLRVDEEIKFSITMMAKSQSEIETNELLTKINSMQIEKKTLSEMFNKMKREEVSG